MNNGMNHDGSEVIETSSQILQGQLDGVGADLLGLDNLENNILRSESVEPSANGASDVPPPRRGMAFRDSDEIYEYYRKYGQQMGFGIFRRDTRKHTDGQPISYRFTCARSGKSRRKEDPIIERVNSAPKTQCPAQITARFRPDGLYYITKVVLEHNHEMLTPSNTRFLRCNRKVVAHGKEVHEDNQKSGVSHNKSCQTRVPVPRDRNNSTSTRKDEKNYADNGRRLRLGEDDAMVLMEYFTREKRRNSNFFYMIDLDNEGKLRNVFWIDGKSRLAYHYFHDVVSLITTNLTNKYQMPFCPFIGINHHGHSVLLGASLLSDETKETYMWLFRAWMDCMCRCPPYVFLTDQCMAISNAVAEVFPQTQHRLCLWHIMGKAEEKLGAHEQYNAIRKRLEKATHESATEDEFEDTWKMTIENFHLQHNTWLKSLYDAKHQWVPILMKNLFCPSMTTIRRTEEMCSFIENLASLSSIRQFIEEYEIGLKEKHEKEKKHDFISRYNKPVLLSNLKLEKQFSEAYTACMFKKFQQEIKSMIECNATVMRQEGAVLVYEVQDDSSGRRKKYVVQFSPKDMNVCCICGHFESLGILCRHAIKVLQVNNITEVPPKYIVNRWRKDFKLICSSSSSPIVVANSAFDRFNDLQMRCDAKFINIVELGSSSVENFHFVLKSVDEMLGKLLQSNVCNPQPVVDNLEKCESDALLNLMTTEMSSVQDSRQSRKRRR